MGEHIPGKFRAGAELTRPANCALAGLAVLIGALISGGTAGWSVYLLAFLAAFLISGGGNALNDFFDRKIDKINRPDRPIPSGRIKPREALRISEALFLAGLVAAALLRNIPCLLLAGFNTLVLIAYSSNLKRTGLPGNIAIGYLVGSTFLFGGLALYPFRREFLPPSLSLLVLLSFLSTVGREVVKSIQDFEGDRRLGLQTFPIKHGKRAGAAAACAFILAAVCLSPLPLLYGILGAGYAIFLLPSLLSFLAAVGWIAKSQTKSSAGRASSYCKLGMFFGLLAFIAGAFF